MKRIEFKLLREHPNVVHGYFLRSGGKSKAPFSSLNVSESVGDDPEIVRENRKIISTELGVSRVVYARLEHGTNIEQVTQTNHKFLPLADALFTTERNLAIGITHADCQVAIFYDPIKGAIGLVHAGWRGLVQNIYEKMCLELKRRIGTNPSDLIVCISPSIGPEYAEYKNYKIDFPKKYWKFQKKENFFDFWEIAKTQLISCGIQQIEISKICTHRQKDDFFSYRRDNVTGRHATIALLVE